MDPTPDARDPSSPAPSAPPSAWPHASPLLLLAFLLALALTACAAIPREATDALGRSWELIEPWARSGALDPELDPVTQEARSRLITEHGRMIEELRRYADSSPPALSP